MIQDVRGISGMRDWKAGHGSLVLGESQASDQLMVGHTQRSKSRREHVVGDSMERESEAESERGVRIRKGSPSPNPNGESESLTRYGYFPFSEFVPFGRIRVLSFLLRSRILGFVPE
ncbi:hypothetical protein AVEN_234472-1 [Araneus ventricosus]|uniref:Uncharacterized protein n=1 Tax=Araneus ventricosus TaxID=182803 RepID=A0A4Y2A8V7_ARAVE|nr:hypothetical protein AVEN_234472-1 [Araneus ventricosus]